MAIMSQQDTYNLLLAQLKSLDLQVIAVHRQFLWQVAIEDQGEKKTYTAVILPSSFEYWRKRYHLAQHPPELVICYEHDTCVNVPVLSLHDGTLFAPCHFPPGFHDYEARSTRRGKQIFLGAILSGVGSALSELDKIPRSTRYRYQNDLKLLRRKKRGRPVEGRKISA